MVKSNKQKGGRISMPSEYYGVKSNRYNKTSKKMNCGKNQVGGKKNKKSLKLKNSLKNLMNNLKGGKAKKSLKNLMKKIK